mmetsp:Transcript_6944/g.7765  ORF Transcript_6944/g.7765 Transcript_6944/m.7765 type:complete len:159 (+) Transcript_6944:3-479(+)
MYTYFRKPQDFELMKQFYQVQSSAGWNSIPQAYAQQQPAMRVNQVYEVNDPSKTHFKGNQKEISQKDSLEGRVNKRILKVLSKMDSKKDVYPKKKTRGRRCMKVTPSEVVLLATFASKFGERRFLEKITVLESPKKERSSSYEGSTVVNLESHKRVKS